jgi:two-component system NarL family response regulator
MKLRILLVDDHSIFREALRGLLETRPDLEVVGEASDGREVLRLARELAPDIVCMDIGMAGTNGIDTTRRLVAAFPGIKVIALSTHADHVYVKDMINAGASAYVTKAARSKELLEAIDAVGRGRQYLCPGIIDSAPEATVHGKPGPSPGLLGNRERQVLCLVAKGMSSQQIASRLTIAPGTVDVHRRNIMRKLDLHSAVELTRYAFNAGLVTD